MHGFSDLGAVLRVGDVAAEVHLLELDDVFELLDALVSCSEAFDHFFDLPFLLADLVEELLLDCL